MRQQSGWIRPGIATPITASNSLGVDLNELYEASEEAAPDHGHEGHEPARPAAQVLGEGGPGADPALGSRRKWACHDRGRASEVEVTASRWSPSYAAYL